MNRRTLLRAAAAAAVSPILLPSIARAASSSPFEVLFVVAHPDDETLLMGTSLAEHAMYSDVHLLAVTDGEKSGALATLNGLNTSTWWGLPHNPAAEGYDPLTEADLANARVREQMNAVGCLASGSPYRIIVHRAGLLDGQVTAADVQAAILALCGEIAPDGRPVHLKGHTYVPQIEGHSDHLAVGNALLNLTALDPMRFGDRRHYVSPYNWTDPDLSLVKRFWDKPDTAILRAEAINALRAYGAWNPRGGSFAIGMHSVPSWFAQVESDPKCLVHS
jgi:LmbE family N-acetylglucosaminyl deacetylase